MLWSIGEARICVRASELMSVPHGSTALLVLRRGELGQLNQIRPFFSERALRMVLLADDDTTIAALEQAPDLLDWISEVVEAESVVPRFAVESIRLIAAAFPGFAWKGSPDALERVLREASPRRRYRELPPEADYTALVHALSDARSWCVTHVFSASAALKLRVALAESRRRGRVVAIGADIPGWPTVAPTSATWDMIDAFEPPLSGDVVARLDSEFDALHGADRTSAVEALAGRSSLPVTRGALECDTLRQLRHSIRTRAKRALRLDKKSDADFVAAWADRTAEVPSLEGKSSILVATALPAAIRNGGGDSEIRAALNQLGWRDVLRHRRGQRLSASIHWLSPAQLIDREQPTDDDLRRGLEELRASMGGPRIHGPRTDTDVDEARALTLEGRLHAALEAAADARHFAPAYLRGVLAVARRLVGRGQPTRARQQLERALNDTDHVMGDESPVRGYLFMELAHIARAHGHLNRAEMAVRKAIRHFRLYHVQAPPVSGAGEAVRGWGYYRAALLVLSSILAEQGRVEAASEVLDEAELHMQGGEDLAREQADLARLRAALFARQGRHAQADAIRARLVERS